MPEFRGTTILSVRRDNQVVIGGDGQVSLGNTVMKGNAKKVRRLHKGAVIAGFAGSTADAFTLFELFDAFTENRKNEYILYIDSFFYCIKYLVRFDSLGYLQRSLANGLNVLHYYTTALQLGDSENYNYWS